MGRMDKIKALAESKAMTLISSGLVTDDEGLHGICLKLVKFKPLLAKKGSDEQVMTLVRSGFGMVEFKPNDESSDEEEAVRLLHGLADKLSGMGMLGLLF